MTDIAPDLALSRYAESGKSGTYRAALAAVAEQTAWDGMQERYPRPLIERLDRLLTFRGRGYSTALFQLCHLVHAAGILAPGPRQWLLPLLGFPGRAEARPLERHLRRLCPAGGRGPVRLEAADLVIAHPGGQTIRLAYGVLPRLVALLELLLGAGLLAEDGAMLRDLDGIAPAAGGAEQVARAKDRLQGRLDRWLDRVQRPQQQQEKLERLVRFLDERGRALGHGGPIRFDDAALLDYWQAAVRDPMRFPDLKRFRTAFEQMVDALQALGEAEEMLALARPDAIGADAEAGEVEPMLVSEEDRDRLGHPGATVRGEGAIPAWRSPLAAFADPLLAATGVLNGAEQARLELLLIAGPAALPLLRSLLRAEVMGAMQARLTEAWRRRGAADATAAQDLLARARDGRLFEDADDEAESYAGLLQGWRRLALQIDRMRRALAHLARLAGEVAAPVDAAAALDQARRTFHRVARAGFRELRAAPALDGVHAAPFLAAAELLEPIACRLDQVIRALERLDAEQGLERCLALDRPIFARSFALLYGEDG